MHFLGCCKEKRTYKKVILTRVPQLLIILVAVSYYPMVALRSHANSLMFTEDKHVPLKDLSSNGIMYKSKGGILADEMGLGTSIFLL